MGGGFVGVETTKLRGVASLVGGGSVPPPEKNLFGDKPASEQAVSELNSVSDETSKDEPTRILISYKA
jgi:hypothetical protein